MSHDVFISHATADHAVALQLASALKQAGHSCWVPVGDLQSGRSSPAFVEAEIATSRVMVIIVSSSAISSARVIRQIEQANSNQLVLLPFSIEEVKLSAALQQLIGSIQGLSATKPLTHLHYEKLLEVVSAMVASESAISARPTTLPGEKTEGKAASRPNREGSFLRDLMRGGALGGMLGSILGNKSVSRNGESKSANGNNEVSRNGGSESTEVDKPSRTTRSLPEEHEKTQPERRLQADIMLADGVDGDNDDDPILTRAFVAASRHRVNLSVGRGASLRLDTSFNEPEFSPDREVEVLELRLVHRQEVSSGTIDLPRDTARNSSVWQAVLEVPADIDKVEAMVVVLHKGRVLQTAALTGVVAPTIAAAITSGENISFSVTADVHDFSNLQGRGSYDASMVTDGKIGAAFAGANIGVRDLKGVDQTIARMTDKLFKASEAITMSGADGDPAKYQKLLVYLAANGKALHSILVQQLMPALDSAERIQIVSTNPSAFLPLEFIYSGPSPESNARLCDGWREALEQGKCPSCQPASDERRSASICPLHFWALSKVIERHAPAALRDDGHDFFVDTRVAGKRENLAPLNQAVFAASDNVPEALVESTMAALKAVVANCEDTRTWADWAISIRNNSPALLVSMPHNALDPLLEISTLEIGSGDDLRAGEVSRKLVCNDNAEVGPIVLLLGCQTATGGPQAFHTFVGEFRHSGAAIVIGTLATVLAEHAAPVAEAIILELAKPANPGENTMGDLLLRIRRKMFAQGILIALAVAAFGDADWALAPPENTP